LRFVWRSGPSAVCRSRLKLAKSKCSSDACYKIHFELIDLKPGNDYNVDDDEGGYMSRSSIVSSRLEPEQERRLVRKVKPMVW
jgi:hypothetical protein